MQNELYIAYSSDDNYAKYLGISMLTLLQTNTDFETIHVYVMDCGISDENRKNLAQIAEKWGREIEFVPMQSALDSLNLRMGAHKIAPAAYARLFLTEIIPQDCDKILYLDCDTIVRDSLRQVWDTAMGSALIAGVQDTVDSYFLKVIDLPEDTKYFNSGVLLINLKAWRDEDIHEQFIEVLKKFEGNVPHHDQGCINAVCKERRICLDVRYNFSSNMYSFPASTIQRIYFLDEFYSQEMLDRAMAHPGIVHFTAGLVGRPWEENCTHPERDAFWAAAKQTPWADMQLRPDSRSTGLKCFIAFYKVMPRPVFEFVYRSLNWALHLKK